MDISGILLLTNYSLHSSNNLMYYVLDKIIMPVNDLTLCKLLLLQFIAFSALSGKNRIHVHVSLHFHNCQRLIVLLLINCDKRV